MTGHRSDPPPGSEAIEDPKEIAYKLTENMPVGAYTMVLEPGYKLARFSFVSTRFLELVGLTRETVLAGPKSGFHSIHPEDKEAWIERNAEAFANQKPFYGEVRLLINGNVRWVIAESIPRALPNGTIVWEGAITDITRQKEAEEDVKKLHRELLKAAEQRARLEERRRILEDMHDGFASRLTWAKIQLSEERIGQPEVKALVQNCIDDFNLVVNSMHNHDKPLKEAIADFRYRMRQTLGPRASNIRWAVRLGEAIRYSQDETLQILRILQEAVTNALKHSQSEEISVAVREEGEKHLVLEVRDFGVGLAAHKAPGLGLRTMKKRAARLEGILEHSPASPGTRIRLVIPVSALTELTRETLAPSHEQGAG